jgi:tRNA (guanine37-N1)-methyltransferase
LIRKFIFISLFPEMIKPFIESSLLGKAKDKGLLSFENIHLRSFSLDKHKRVDDTPYGGGEGMVIKPEVLASAIRHAKGLCDSPYVVYLSPQGHLLTQSYAREFVQTSRDLILIAGHYEGIDQRVIESLVDEELSVGDYILTGGELASVVVVDVLARLIPGVLGNESSQLNDSFDYSGGLLKYPQYTKPREWEGRPVPEVLLSGDHQAIEKWRIEQSQAKTEVFHRKRKK